PTNLTDHLAWQLGALSLRREVREAADLIIGNLNEDGYLIASDDELLGVAPPAAPEVDAQTAKNIVNEAQALGLTEIATESDPEDPAALEQTAAGSIDLDNDNAVEKSVDLNADVNADFHADANVDSVYTTEAAEP